MKRMGSERLSRIKLLKVASVLNFRMFKPRQFQRSNVPGTNIASLFCTPQNCEPRPDRKPHSRAPKPALNKLEEARPFLPILLLPLGEPIESNRNDWCNLLISSIFSFRDRTYQIENGGVYTESAEPRGGQKDSYGFAA